VLTEASISGQVDHLLGLKENVIIGKLIPARAEVKVEPLPARISEIALPLGFADNGDGNSDEWVAELIADDIDESLEDDFTVDDPDATEVILEEAMAEAGPEIEKLPGVE
jgi:DNA-directed RNA polymerase subunit beta'